MFNVDDMHKKVTSHGFIPIEFVNAVLDMINKTFKIKAKNIGIAYATARLFNEDIGCLISFICGNL